MGIFSRKTEVYARNTLIAELESRVESLTNKIEKLRNENAELRASLSNLKATNDALLVENQAFSHNLKRLRKEDDESLQKAISEDSDESLENKKKAHKLEQELLYRYALELKRLKFFSNKWQSYFHVEKIEKKQELVSLINEILTTDNPVQFTLEAREKADVIHNFMGEPFEPQKLIKEHFEADDYVFDLDEVVSPNVELNLEQLCKELGVFKG